MGCFCVCRNTCNTQPNATKQERTTTFLGTNGRHSAGNAAHLIVCLKFRWSITLISHMSLFFPWKSPPFWRNCLLETKQTHTILMRGGSLSVPSPATCETLAYGLPGRRDGGWRDGVKAYRSAGSRQTQAPLKDSRPGEASRVNGTDKALSAGGSVDCWRCVV